MISIPKSNLPTESPRKLLDAVYEKLGYQDGVLLNASDLPLRELQETSVWLEKGDWLTMAASVGAEKIFFVNNDPVIVFYEAPDNNEQTLLNVFRQAWCMGRPQCLFIASPGELTSYSLNQSPAQSVEDWPKVKTLDVIRRTTEVSEKLQAYRREQVESGRLFIEKDFGGVEQRVDKQLILDLKAVRQSLLNVKPTVDQRYIHALLGRSIFVRYLEDRGVLTPEYFQKIAEDTSHPKWVPEWLTIVEQPDDADLSPQSEHRRYAHVLRNKDLTYALFNQLAEHFNGDMFPRDLQEEDAIAQDHLNLLRGFLLGDVNPEQKKLFLWAYDFEIIPIELISSIYEEFYHQSSKKDKGTHYTPSVLVEYMLSQVLTPERLATKPRILDFACGSAIFLVQAFQRIVRYHESQTGRHLSAHELREILRNQLAGVEINEEAVHVAAFSLYLALLHYQEPKSILAQIEQAEGDKPLPFLIYDENHSEDSQHYSVLFHANSFSLMEAEREFIKQRLDSDGRFQGRTDFEALYNSAETLPFETNSFDVIIGNPPWGYLGLGYGKSELRAVQEHVLRWCTVFNWEPGDYEMSQAFIGRSLSLLKPNGECGLLVSAGVVFKRGRKSVEFRRRWLSETKIKQVTNFAHVRDVFFTDAISPFCFVQFKSCSANPGHSFQYWSAKKTGVVNKLQSVILGLPDLHRIRQVELLNDDYLWKVYWWGSHRDAAFIRILNLEDRLHKLVEERKWDKGQGYTPGSTNPPEWLAEYLELPIGSFKRYGDIEANKLHHVPRQVHRRGIREIYFGWRLLIKRGITQAENANGQIISRLENERYCFRNSIHGISVQHAEDWERKTLIGILWSSLSRYYLFMTTSSWIPWYTEIHLEDGLMNMPVRFPDNPSLRKRIVTIVDELQAWSQVQIDLLHPDGLTEKELKDKQGVLENNLDKAIFELYELNEAEQDLVLDMCETGLEFFYRWGAGEAVANVALSPQIHGAFADLPAHRSEESGLEGYLYAFLQLWNQELKSVNGEFRWHIICPPRVPMLAVVFSTQQKGEPLTDVSSADDNAVWNALLERLDKSLRYPVSSRIYVDGMVRAVTDTEIIIVKRDERRL